MKRCCRALADEASQFRELMADRFQLGQDLGGGLADDGDDLIESLLAAATGQPALLTGAGSFASAAAAMPADAGGRVGQQGVEQIDRVVVPDTPDAVDGEPDAGPLLDAHFPAERLAQQHEPLELGIGVRGHGFLAVAGFNSVPNLPAR